MAGGGDLPTSTAKPGRFVRTQPASFPEQGVLNACAAAASPDSYDKHDYGLKDTPASGPVFDRLVPTQACRLHLKQFAVADLNLQPSTTTDLQAKHLGRGLVEIVDDIVGDNDGLCEPGERCLLASHLGAWQRELNDSYKSLPRGPIDIDADGDRPYATVTSYTGP